MEDSCFICRSFNELYKIGDLEGKITLPKVILDCFSGNYWHLSFICGSCMQLCCEYNDLQKKITQIEDTLLERYKTAEDDTTDHLQLDDNHPEYEIIESSSMSPLQNVVEIKHIPASEKDLYVDSVDETEEEKLFKTHGNDFYCNRCQLNEPFSAESITVHLMDHHSSRVYICLICSAYFGKKTELTMHRKLHSSMGKQVKRSEKCKECNRDFENFRQLKHHIKVNHSESTATGKQWPCQLCSKVFISKNLLNDHQNTHRGERPFKCNICDSSFSSKYILTSHLRIHTNRPRPFKCSQCGKAFLTQTNLTHHIKTHDSNMAYVCEVCNKTFRTERSLLTHGIVHTGQKNFQCNICEKAFARRVELKDHGRVHSGERPFVCSICGAAFAQKSNMTTHRRVVHLNDTRYKCDLCERKFKRQRLLDYHIKAVHTGKRSFKCEICLASFISSGHYKRHLIIHSEEKSFPCDICGKLFNDRHNRNAHRLTHSNKKVFTCELCDKGFLRRVQLQIHLDKEHRQSSAGDVAETGSKQEEIIAEQVDDLETCKIREPEDEWGLGNVFMVKLNEAADQETEIEFEADEDVNDTTKALISEDEDGQKIIITEEVTEMPWIKIHTD